MQWHRMSKPTEASTFFGMVVMQSGSTMAEQRRLFLSPLAGLVSTAKPLPSEPVPQVVGMRMGDRPSSLALWAKISVTAAQIKTAAR